MMVVLAMLMLMTTTLMIMKVGVKVETSLTTIKTLATMALVSLGTWVFTNMISSFSWESKQC